ncbi:MAG: hypothetical protein H0X64_03745 [Gemmatimonadaceae bacterium]|nr:hypothetical protein [Gemmatimonadaceae bacterium]
MFTTSTSSTHDIPRLRARRGFAMALALGAIVVIGLLIAGVQFTTNQQVVAGRSSAIQEQAFRLAESGLNTSLANWNSGTVRDSTVTAGKPTTILTKSALTLPANTLVDSVNVTATRLNPVLYQVTSTAHVGSGPRNSSTRSVSQLVRLLTAQINILGALTVVGETKIGGSSLINGNDQSPAGWTCDATQPAKAGIAISNANLISTSGCNNMNCISGSPKILETAEASNPDTFFKFGDTSWDQLVAMATLTMTTNPSPAPVVIGTTCNRTVNTNWGDVGRWIPTRPCESYYPIIYYPGDAHLTGGTGQGILLVGGDLSVQGGFKFFGPVIIRGRLQTAGTGGHFNGAVMAANVDLAENSVLGNAVVNYSSCAVASALKNLPAPPIPVRHRAWTEAF